MKKIIYASLISLLFLTGCAEKQNNIERKSVESTSITNKSDFISEIPLHDAVRAKDFQLVKELVDNGSEVNLKDKYAYTPLHIAARLNEVEIAEYLISNGASVNTVDTYKDTPLLDSTRNSTNAMSKLLLCNGANKNVVDRHSMSPLHNASKNNDLFIVKMIEGEDMTQMCEKLDITLDYFDENENKICGKILTGYPLDVDLTITQEASDDIKPFGKYEGLINDDMYCAKLDKQISRNKNYIVTAIGTNTVDRDVEIANLNDLRPAVAEDSIYITGLYEDLMEEFKSDFAPWNAELDKNGLVFRFKKPELLFNHGSSDLSKEYKAILDDFFPRYIKVINKYRDEVSLVKVEGHSSSVYGNAKTDAQRYSKNKALSTARANNVYNYTSKINDTIVKDSATWLRNYYKPFGMAYDDLIYNDDGTENEVLSRRVEFRINKIVK